MEEYLSYNGWHFNRKMCDWAVSRMRDRNGNAVAKYDSESFGRMANQHAMDFTSVKGYDHIYLANMAMADHFGSAITDEKHLLLFVKDLTDDKDGYDGMAFTRFYADCIGSGTPIPWEDMI